MVTRRAVLRALDVDRIRTAIERAEERTSGEIRVSLSPFFLGDVAAVARRAMARLGMMATRERNAVLIFVVPSRRRFAILGDRGIHEKGGAALWERAASAMAEEFRREAFTEGIVRAVEILGAELSSHFPVDPGNDVNELPDEPAFYR